MLPQKFSAATTRTPSPPFEAPVWPPQPGPRAADATRAASQPPRRIRIGIVLMLSALAGYGTGLTAVKRNRNHSHRTRGYHVGVSQEIHDAVAARLKGAEGRYTNGRRALVGVLLAAQRPLTVDEILERSPGIRQSSVYRNLAVFEVNGLVHRIAGHDDFARYELAEEIVGHHHHFACRSCGAVADVELPRAVEQALDIAIGRLARRRGLTVDAHRI